MGDPIPLEPEPSGDIAGASPRAGAGPRTAPAGAPAPCPGCGWPVAANAAICTRCGQRLRADGPGDKVTTRVRKTETLAPLPAQAGSIRWRNERIGTYSERVPRIKSIAWIVIGIGGTLVMRGINPGVDDLAPFLGRFAILSACAVALVAVSRFIFVDTDASWLLVVLGVTGAMAGAEVAQHVVRDTIPFFGLVAWPVGYIVCGALLVDLMDLEFTEGALLGLPLILLKLFLKWTLFAHFLAPP